MASLCRLCPAILAQLGADMTTMIVENTAYCGMAWVITDPTSTSQASSAFSIVSYTCWNGYHSMAHELGHNMGE